MTVMLAAALLPLGILPETVLETGAFQFLAAFVAVNTIMYVTLAVAKMLPKVYLSDWRPGRARRKETRSIYPEDRGEAQRTSVGDGASQDPDPL